MFIQLKRFLNKNDKYLILSFIASLIPASFIIHIIPTDFSGFYFQAISFLKYHGHAYQIIENYCQNPLNSGVNARAPVVPLLMAITIGLFGKNLLGIYLPFYFARILIFPLTYLVGRYYLPQKIAFLPVLLLLVIPKLQTYSFGTFEADSFIALFFLIAWYFYLKSQNLGKKKYILLSAISLSLGALSKSIGLSVAIGFILAIFLQNLSKLRKLNILKNFIIFLICFLIPVGPYLAWTFLVHHQIYLSTHYDKSLVYIVTNLPSLILTVPLYLGISFPVGLKSIIVSLVMLIILIIGIIRSLIMKNFLLTFPTIITLILISTLSSCLIGGNIPGSLEFITILGFMMIPTVILFMIGVESCINLLFRYLFRRVTPAIVINILLVIIFFKFMNNYFTSPYALNYISNQYYISLATVIKNKSSLPDVNFKIENGLRIFTGPVIHQEIRKMYTNFRFDPFSSFYKYLLTCYIMICLIVFVLDKNQGMKKLN